MGVPILPEDWIIGFLVMVIILLAIMGPIFFYSEFSNVSVLNPVKSSDLTLSLVISKSLST